MNKQSLISVIIPVYNVEKYLKICLESVVNQTYKNLEIIIVNDGSTDNSLNIMNKYKSDKRVKIYSKENGGLSSARNYGIDNSHGEFISFIDSDDYISNDFIEKLYKQIKCDNSDISMCRYIREENKFTHTYAAKKLNSEDALEKILYQDDQTLYSVAAWNKLYRKEIFDDIRYPYGKYNEDMFIICEVMKKVKQISICDFVGYYYRINANSITQEKFSSKRLDVVEACDHIINAINGKKNLEDAAVNLKFRRCFEMYAKIIKAENREKYKQEEINLKLELKKLSKAIISDNKSKMSSKLAALSVKVSIPLTKIIILMISKG